MVSDPGTAAPFLPEQVPVLRGAPDLSKAGTGDVGRGLPVTVHCRPVNTVVGAPFAHVPPPACPPPGQVASLSLRGQASGILVPPSLVPAAQRKGSALRAFSPDPDTRIAHPDQAVVSQIYRKRNTNNAVRGLLGWPRTRLWPGGMTCPEPGGSERLQNDLLAALGQGTHGQRARGQCPDPLL